MAYLASSFVLEVVVRFRFGTGILHSIEKATQFVHGTLLHRQQLSRIVRGALTLMMLHHSEPLWDQELVMQDKRSYCYYTLRE